MITYFVVQSFQRGKKGIVMPDTPVQAATRDQALRLAERLAPTKQAVVAFSRTGDAKDGEWEPAVILAVHGHVPEEIEDEFAAA